MCREKALLLILLSFAYLCANEVMALASSDTGNICTAVESEEEVDQTDLLELLLLGIEPALELKPVFIVARGDFPTVTAIAQEASPFLSRGPPAA